MSARYSGFSKSLANNNKLLLRDRGLYNCKKFLFIIIAGKCFFETNKYSLVSKNSIFMRIWSKEYLFAYVTEKVCEKKNRKVNLRNIDCKQNFRNILILVYLKTRFSYWCFNFYFYRFLYRENNMWKNYFFYLLLFIRACLKSILTRSGSIFP